MPDSFLLLPENDEALILREDTAAYGLPQPTTFAKWACMPSEAPCEIPYVIVGRKAAMTAGTLRRVREAMTFRHSADRAAARSCRNKAATAEPAPEAT